MLQPDDDVKIYSSEEEGEQLEFWEGEQAAEEYIFHRDCGNLTKTKRIGELLARTLVEAASQLCRQTYGPQMVVMLSYLAKDAIVEGIGNQMLRETAADAFLKSVAERSEVVNNTITDSTAFTLYMLNDRRGGGKSDGEILTELCDRDGDERLIAEGNDLAQRYRSLFSDVISAFSFEEYQV